MELGRRGELSNNQNFSGSGRNIFLVSDNNRNPSDTFRLQHRTQKLFTLLYITISGLVICLSLYVGIVNCRKVKVRDKKRVEPLEERRGVFLPSDPSVGHSQQCYGDLVSVEI